MADTRAERMHRIARALSLVAGAAALLAALIRYLDDGEVDPLFVLTGILVPVLTFARTRAARSRGGASSPADPPA